jgi:hypothetical protein
MSRLLEKGIAVRTTLDIEDDVLLAIREIARQQGLTMGEVVSDLARRALTRQPAGSSRSEVPLIPVRPDGGVVTLELVNRLRELDE